MRLVLDTGVLIAADALPADAEVAVASVTFAELAYGVRAATDALVQALRRDPRARALDLMIAATASANDAGV